MPAPTAWVETARQRARHRLAAARRGWSPPPFTAVPELGGTTRPVVTQRQQPPVDYGLPRGVRIRAVPSMIGNQMIGTRMSRKHRVSPRAAPWPADIVLVLDTSLMNVSISAVVEDLDTTVSDAAQHITGQAVQQRGEKRPIGKGEPDLLAAQVPFEDRALVPEREDLGVLVSVTHRQELQQRERVVTPR